MRKLSGILALIAILVTAQESRAQAADTSTSKPATKAQPTTEEALDNLQKAAAELSRAVEVAVTKVANSPELKSAALQIAANAVTVAQQSLGEQLKMIEAALNAASRQIAAAQTANTQKSVPATQAPSK